MTIDVRHVKALLEPILDQAQKHPEEYVEVRPHAVELGRLLTGELRLENQGQLFEMARRVLVPYLSLRGKTAVPERLRLLARTHSSAEQLFMSIPTSPSPVEDQQLRIDEDHTPLPALASLVEAVGQRSTLAKPSNEVFIVHGHDHAHRDAVEALLRRVSLNPVILDDQPNRGQTVIEKFETNTTVGYAVVILSADDLGESRTKLESRATQEDRLGSLRLRARQNVIFELGYLMASLGRSRVTALYVEGVEIPSDYNGVAYIELDSATAWKHKLLKELKAANVPGDYDAF